MCANVNGCLSFFVALWLTWQLDQVAACMTAGIGNPERKRTSTHNTDGWRKSKVFTRLKLLIFTSFLLLSQNHLLKSSTSFNATSRKWDKKTKEVITEPITCQINEKKKALWLSYNASLMIVMLCLCCMTSCYALVAFLTILSTWFASRLSPTVFVTHLFSLFFF